MNETEYLLTTLSEECAEVSQRACKAVRFGLLEIQPGQMEDNTRRIERELADLMAVADLLGLRVRDEDKAAKIEKLKKYMAYSREIGTLSQKPVGVCDHCIMGSDGKHQPDCCRDFDTKKKKCSSTYSHSTHGKLTCEKDEGHLNRVGDVEHYSRNVKWMSI